MTSSIPNDSLQALLEISDQGIIDSLASMKAELEGLYNSQDSPLPKQEILEDLEMLFNIGEQIGRTNHIRDKIRIIQEQLFPLYKNIKLKYSDFIPSDFWKEQEEEEIRFEAQHQGLKLIKSMLISYQISDLTQKAIIFYQNILGYAIFFTAYLPYLHEDELIGHKTMFRVLLEDPFLQPNQPNIAKSAIAHLVYLQNGIRGILWQLEHGNDSLAEYLKTLPESQRNFFEESSKIPHNVDELSEPKLKALLKEVSGGNQLSDAEFEDILNETQGIWTKGNGLAYQEQVRTGNYTDNIKQEMTGQEAAQFLKIPYVSFLKLLEKGELSYHEVNSCKRITLEDLIVYKQKRDEQRRQAKRELTAFLEDEGFYDDDYSMS
ncbi:MAG: helix-turn-helix domain-containing protein [Microcystaceae cyanobacterium]